MGLVQCRHCGGYKVRKRVRLVSPVTGRTPTDHTARGFLVGLLFGIALACAIRVAIPPTAGINASWMMFVAIAGSIAGIVHGSVLNKIQPEPVGLYRFTCELCGNMWRWRSDEPWPSTPVAPNVELLRLAESRVPEAKRLAEVTAYLNDFD